MRMVLICLVLFLASTALCSAQEERAVLQQRWIDRAIETTLAVVSNPDVADYETEYSVGMTSQALGLIGCVGKAREMLDKPGLEAGSKLREQFVLGLADGLAASDHVDEAYVFTEMLENVNLRGTALYLTPIRQSQRGDFADAEKLLDRIPLEHHRDRAIDQICQEYLKVNRLDDARRLCASLSDHELLTATEKKIEQYCKQPWIRDGGYVEYKVSELSKRASADELEFLEPYFRAQVALELQDMPRFESESKRAKRLVEGMESNDGSLMMLGRLMYQAGKKDDAKELYLMLLRNYSVKTEMLDFNIMLFGSGKPSDAHITADCLTTDQAQPLLERLLKHQSAQLVAAPLFGAVVSLKNPEWAEQMYQSTTDPKLKSSLACWCVISLAESTP